MLRGRDGAPPARHDGRHELRRGLRAGRRRPRATAARPAGTRATATAPTCTRTSARSAPAGGHGEAFHYVSPNTDMLGWVCERAGGQRYADALSTYVWGAARRRGRRRRDGRPPGRDARGGRPLRRAARHGAPRTARDRGTAPASSTPSSCATCARAAIPPSGRAATTPTSCRAAPTGAAGTSRGSSPAWPARSGSTASSIYADPVREVVVAKQSSWPVAGDDDGDRLAIAAARAIAAALAP